MKRLRKFVYNYKTSEKGQQDITLPRLTEPKDLPFIHQRWKDNASDHIKDTEKNKVIRITIRRVSATLTDVSNLCCCVTGIRKAMEPKNQGTGDKDPRTRDGMESVGKETQ